MKSKIINPLTRISGLLEIEVEIEGRMIVEAKSSGVLFRGYEIMLNGRPPLDAIYFTQRICGICSTAHSTAASLALEEALGVVPTEQGRALRDLVHCCEFLQNHLRHFYQFTLPDYVCLPREQCLFQSENTDWRLPKEENDLLASHYFRSLEMSRNAHQMLAVLAGKAPHDHGIFVGGITVQPTVDKIIKFSSLLKEIKGFVEDCMIPDVTAIGRCYEEYFHLGGGYGNLLSYGLFQQIQGLPGLYLGPGLLVAGSRLPFDREKISEWLTYSWYLDGEAEKPAEGSTKPETGKAGAYSWVKAPRYAGIPCEVGPLARMILSGDYAGGISAMDRTLARVLEVQKIIGIMEKILDFIQPGEFFQAAYQVPQEAEGAGLTDTTRGALGHWLKISGGLISHYQIVTPSAWNLSPKDGRGIRGVVEEALVGTPVADPEHPVEIGRIVRSFDPCISCATHVYSARGHKTYHLL